jgi:hypothetical protein
MHAWDAANLDKATWVALPLGLRIRLAAYPFLGWAYRYAAPATPYTTALTSGLALEGDRTTNCSTLTTTILGAVYPDAAWTSREYGDLQVFADRLPSYPDSPIRAVQRMGVGSPVDDFDASGWYLCQGWWSLGAKPSGHAVLIEARPDGIWVLQASSGIGPTWGKAAKHPRDIFDAAVYIARLRED